MVFSLFSLHLRDKLLRGSAREARHNLLWLELGQLQTNLSYLVLCLCCFIFILFRVYIVSCFLFNFYIQPYHFHLFKSFLPIMPSGRLIPKLWWVLAPERCKLKITRTYSHKLSWIMYLYILRLCMFRQYLNKDTKVLIWKFCNKNLQIQSSRSVQGQSSGLMKEEKQR